MTPLERSDIEALVPHRGAMCLLDHATAWDERSIACAATGHRDPAHPLRTAGGLLATAAIEYAAQAAALHGGLVARDSGGRAPPGLLASARDVQLARWRLDDLPIPEAGQPDELAITAERQAGDAARILYAWRVSHAGSEVASGRLAVVLLPGATP